MNDEPRIGLGLVVALALCCVGPIGLSLLGSGAVLSALGGAWVDARAVRIGIGALLVIIGILVLARATRARSLLHFVRDPAPRQVDSLTDKEESM